MIKIHKSTYNQFLKLIFHLYGINLKKVSQFFKRRKKLILGDTNYHKTNLYSLSRQRISHLLKIYWVTSQLSSYPSSLFWVMNSGTWAPSFRWYYHTFIPHEQTRDLENPVGHFRVTVHSPESDTESSLCSKLRSERPEGEWNSTVRTRIQNQVDYMPNPREFLDIEVHSQSFNEGIDFTMLLQSYQVMVLLNFPNDQLHLVFPWSSL